MTRAVLIILGSIFLGLGTLGILLPLLPTTPFFLLAAVCYARSSKRLHNWLLTNKWFGSHLKNYLEGHGASLRMKAFFLSFLWVTIGCSAALVVHTLPLRIILVIIAVGITIHIVLIRTLRQ
ncbi:YbaN family protein [Chloroflexota bacterium]